MTLLDIRKQFVHLTGRFDLVKDTHSFGDKGADFFIQNGQRKLDTMLDFEGADAQFTAELSVGQMLVGLPGCQTVSEVYLTDSNERTILLSELTREEAFSKYGAINHISTLSNGLPCSYTVVNRRFLANNSNILPDSYQKVAGLSYISIMLFPPSQSDNYKLDVFGRFFSTPLKNDTDVSWWSISYPDTLLHAAMYSMERFYRNSEGANDQLSALQQDIMDIDFIEARKDRQSRMQMRDSW